MNKQHKVGRPLMYTYEEFVDTWKALKEEGRARVVTVQDILGGSKSTITGFIEKFERDEAAKKIDLIKYTELPKAVSEAIANMKIKQIDELEATKKQLNERLDENIQHLKEAESKLSEAQTSFDERRTEFGAKEKNFERELSASEALRKQAEDREKNLLAQIDQLRDQLSQAKQDAAVAQKEVEILSKAKNDKK